MMISFALRPPCRCRYSSRLFQGIAAILAWAAVACAAAAGRRSACHADRRPGRWRNDRAYRPTRSPGGRDPRLLRPAYGHRDGADRQACLRQADRRIDDRRCEDMAGRAGSSLSKQGGRFDARPGREQGWQGEFSSRDRRSIFSKPDAMAAAIGTGSRPWYWRRRLST